MNPNDSALLRQSTSTGALMLIGLGALLLAHDFVAGPLHNPIMLGIIACGFGALYAFGGSGLRWARIPALVFAALAPFALLSAAPWHWFEFGFGLSFWPLLLIALGLWFMRRDRRWA